MAFFVQLLANYAGLIYIGCVIGAAFYIREIIAAQRDLQKSLYSLEREAASGRAIRGAMMIALLGVIAIATYLLATVVAPKLPAQTLDSTPTPLFVLPTGTPTPTFQPSPTPTGRTVTPAPSGAAIPLTAINSTPPPPSGPTLTLPPLPAASCPDPDVQLVAPVPGQTFSDKIQLRGTADTPNFAFYKFTLQGPATGGLEQTAGDVVREPRRDTVLGEIDPAAFLNQPGVYIVGLVVVDNTGNEYPHCTIPIVIQPPAP